MNQFPSRSIHLTLALAAPLALLTALLVILWQAEVAAARPLHTPTQQFSINFGDTVSDGVPGPGAGNIEFPGDVDDYTFQATAGQEAIFNWLTGSNGHLGWQLLAPDGTMLFDSNLRDWQVALTQSGTYTLTVDGLNPNNVGLYSFQLLAVPTPQQFTINIGDTVSDGVPSTGAGNLETPGAIDIYTFSAAAGQEIVSNWLSGSNVHIGWQLQAPDGSVLFDSVLSDRQLVLAQSGTYTLTVDGNSIDSFGLYSFQLLLVPQPQQFSIAFNDTISDGEPAAGAGNLETPGAIDIYNFHGAAGQEAIFDWLSGSNVRIGWQLQAPDGAVLFDSVLSDRQVVLTQTGTYTLTVDGNAIDSTGLYSFQLLEVTAVPQFFAISFGDTVSDGVPAPGAGNIETPGALDIYTFDALAGQAAIFDWLTGSNVQLVWQLQAPDGTVLFDSELRDWQVVLPQSGTYTLTVDGRNIDDTGQYSFQFLEAPAAPQYFSISFGDTVSDGVPAPGAGNLEVPGAVDIYTFDALAGQAAIFDWLSGVNTAIGWQLQAPDNTILFDSELHDWQVDLPQSGTYTLTVDGNNVASFGLYSFQLVEVPAAAQQFAISFGDTVSDGVPAPGAGSLETPGAVDVYTFTAVAGQEAIFEVVSGNPLQFDWQLMAPDNSILFDSSMQDQQITLPQSGSYTLTVSGHEVDSFGSYAFVLSEAGAGATLIFLPVILQ